MKTSKKLKMFRLKPEKKNGLTRFRMQVKISKIINVWTDTPVIFYDKKRGEKKVAKLNKFLIDRKEAKIQKKFKDDVLESNNVSA